MLNGSKTQCNPIIEKYKFTNCYRVLDRTTQYLVKNISSSQTDSPGDVFLRTILFKNFNKIETWQAIEDRFGKIGLNNFNSIEIAKFLSELRAEKSKIYSAAYIMPSGKSQWGSSIKHENNLKMISHMLKLELHHSIWDHNHLGDIYNAFLKMPSIGKFLAFQYSVDIAYSTYSQATESQFVIAGPGAVRGIKKCFPDAVEKEFTYIIEKMADQQESEFERLGLQFQPLQNRALQLIDCQNIFCEVDKYLRVKRPELNISTSRIKQNYTPHKERIHYQLPEKWKAAIPRTTI